MLCASFCLHSPECLGYIANVSSSNIKIIVWDCLTYYGVGTLAFIDGNMNSQKYIQTLDDNIWPVVTTIPFSTDY
jgi:uncharacterized protein YuzB (UPF0349 family)